MGSSVVASLGLPSPSSEGRSQRVRVKVPQQVVRKGVWGEAGVGSPCLVAARICNAHILMGGEFCIKAGREARSLPVISLGKEP